MRGSNVVVGMSRIDDTFTRLRSTRATALIPYLTAGYPRKELTVPIMLTLEKAGADVIEIGVPFSDPVADGPTIQKSSMVALDLGVCLDWIIETIRQFRKQGGTVPVVMFGALNPFLKYGLEKLAKDAASAGVDALLIPDLPAEESDEVLPILKANGLQLIHLVAPTTSQNRMQEICNTSQGFIYYISLKGVTGARSDLKLDLEKPLAELRSCTTLPIAVGFGISTPEQAVAVARHADGVIVGSALINLIEKYKDDSQLLDQVASYMSGMKSAIVPES